MQFWGAYFSKWDGKKHQLTICFQTDTPTKPPPSFTIASTNQVIMLYGVPLSTCVTGLSGNGVLDRMSAKNSDPWATKLVDEQSSKKLPWTLKRLREPS